MEFKPSWFAEAPRHLFSIPQLSFIGDLEATTLEGPWFRLGAWSLSSEPVSDNVDVTVMRLSLLVPQGSFAQAFESLDSIGNVIGRMGRPGGSVTQHSDKREYRYEPFHRYEIGLGGIVGEPLLFTQEGAAPSRLFLNPDFTLFFALVEKSPGTGIWWDPRNSVEVLVHRTIKENLEVVEVRSEYLRRYLRARQMSLLVGHYCHRHFFDPPETVVGAFVEEDVILGSPEQRVKAVIQNWGLRKDIGRPFLQRRLHLWFEIPPPPICIDDPWAEEPSFDPYQFVLPTLAGPVAPARWANFPPIPDRDFEGTRCDFMDRIYFRQEVLSKYEATSGFSVGDDGSVSCRHYWGLTRSTARFGNELVATAIGDFAEGVPFEEWQHWKQFSVEPPSHETVEALRQEQGLCELVNMLDHSLADLNSALASFARTLSAVVSEPLWQGSIESLAGRQLKWVYPSGATDDEFIKRATLLSTFVLEGVKTEVLRQVLSTVGSDLHLKDKKTLGSRNLMQRTALMAGIMRTTRAPLNEVPALIALAEQGTGSACQNDLQEELTKLATEVRREFTPLAMLYDFRSFGGVAHLPNEKRIAQAAALLGLPEQNWHRRDYLSIVKQVATAVQRIASRLFLATTGV